MKRTIVKDGVKPAFLGMLDLLILPNSNDFEELSDWSFLNPILSTDGVGAQETIVNTYEGIKYIWKPAETITTRAAVPANLNGFTGKTYKGFYDMMTGQMVYTETSDLYEIQYAEFLNPPDEPEILDIHQVQPGAKGAIKPIYSTVAAGYVAIQGNEVGTHGKDGNTFKPLSFWNETVVGSSATEYTGTIVEGKSGFTLDSKKIGLNLTSLGEVLPRYTPLDLITFAKLIKMQYDYRLNSTIEENIL